MVKEIYVWTNNLVFRYLLKKKILRPNPPEQVRRLLSTQITADLSLHFSGGYKICLLVHADAKILLLLSETSSNSFKNHGYIWSAISKYGIYFENSFLMDKCSCKRKQKGSFDIFKVCGIFCNFNSQFAKTILWSLFILSGVSYHLFWATDAFDIIDISPPLLKSAKHSSTICFKGA